MIDINKMINSQSGEEKGTRFTSMSVPIELLKPSDKNIYGIRGIEELAASIESMGLMHDLLVKPADAQGRYEIISGERRYRACLLLHEADAAKFATVPCKVAEPESEALSELRLIYANATTRELTDYEKTYQAGRIKELLKQLRSEGYNFQGRMRDVVADILNVSQSQMARMESINERLDKRLKTVFASGGIGISTAYDASTLPKPEQTKALGAFRKGGPRAMKSVIASARSASDTPVRETFAPAGADQLRPPRRCSASAVRTMAHQLRIAAESVPYDAVCDDRSEEINIRAACIRAADMLDDLA